MKDGSKVRGRYKHKSDVDNDGDKVAKYANGLFFKTNPLHFDIFDGVCQMEAEVVQMCINMYKGGDSECGIIDTSEADCIRNAVLAYREWAKDVKGITKPNIVAPATFDPSLERACELLDVEFRRISMNDKLELGKLCTLSQIYIHYIDLRKLGKAVDDNTIAIFCSAPDQYFGVFGKLHFFISIPTQVPHRSCQRNRKICRVLWSRVPCRL